jgi:hypothetical protein
MSDNGHDEGQGARPPGTRSVDYQRQMIATDIRNPDSEIGKAIREVIAQAVLQLSKKKARRRPTSNDVP